MDEDEIDERFWHGMKKVQTERSLKVIVFIRYAPIRRPTGNTFLVTDGEPTQCLPESTETFLCREKSSELIQFSIKQQRALERPHILSPSLNTL
jgi:hypothetical protein